MKKLSISVLLLCACVETLLPMAGSPRSRDRRGLAPIGGIDRTREANELFEQMSRRPRNPHGAGPEGIQSPLLPPRVGASPILTKIDGSSYMVFKNIQPGLDVPAGENEVVQLLESNGFVLVRRNIIEPEEVVE